MNNYSKPSLNFKTPDLTKLQEVIIDFRTKIYIAIGANPEKAKLDYLARRETINKPSAVPKKINP